MEVVGREETDRNLLEKLVDATGKRFFRRKTVVVASKAHRAASIAAQQRLVGLVHPNVVRTLAVYSRGTHVISIMENLVGKSLRTRIHEFLDREYAMSDNEVATYLIGIARGLAAIHARGVVHGDVDACNVVLALGGVPVLVDFEMARVDGWSATTSDVTHDMFLTMEPDQRMELTRRRGRFTWRTSADIYALVSVLTEMYCGCRVDETCDAEGHIDDLRGCEPSLGNLFFPCPLEVRRSMLCDTFRKLNVPRAERPDAHALVRLLKRARVACIAPALVQQRSTAATVAEEARVAAT